MGGPFSAHEALPMVYPGTSAGQGVVPLGWVPLVPSCQASFLMDVNYRGGGGGAGLELTAAVRCQGQPSHNLS